MEEQFNKKIQDVKKSDQWLLFQNNISIKILKASLEAFFIVVEHKIDTSQVKLFIIFKYSSYIYTGCISFTEWGAYISVPKDISWIWHIRRLSGHFRLKFAYNVNLDLTGLPIVPSVRVVFRNLG